MPKEGVLDDRECVCWFFMGLISNKQKFNWIGWHQLCYPQKEGSTGFRALEDIYIDFSWKLWWNFKKGSSFWANFMRMKYYSDLHPCQVKTSVSSLTTWKHMLNVRALAKLNILWIVNDENCYSWYDNLVGTEWMSFYLILYYILWLMKNGMWSYYKNGWPWMSFNQW